MTLTHETPALDFGTRRALQRASSPSIRTRVDSLAVSARDRTIIVGALERLEGSRFRFEDALRALRDSTEATIAAGRVFYLATTDEGPILGSTISGVGIASIGGVTALVRVDGHGVITRLGRFAP